MIVVVVVGLCGSLGSSLRTLCCMVVVVVRSVRRSSIGTALNKSGFVAVVIALSRSGCVTLVVLHSVRRVV